MHYQKVILEQQIVAFNSHSIGPASFEECIIMVGHSDNTLFVGTASNNTENLLTTLKKNGLVGRLPVV